MPCPFLTRLSTNYVRNYAPVLLKTYGQQCPVASHSISSLQTPPASNVNSDESANNSSLSNDTKCPFLSTESTDKIVRNVSENIADIPTERAFAYENFFHEQIQRKKKDHSYRIFKKVSRLAGIGEFPKAFEYSWGEKPITVWWYVLTNFRFFSSFPPNRLSFNVFSMIILAQMTIWACLVIQK